VPGAESVASCLVDGMLFIILQVRSEQTAACVSLVMMIPTYDYSENLDVNSLSEVPLDTFISPQTRKDRMLTILC
jgi:hypothetical protein